MNSLLESEQTDKIINQSPINTNEDIQVNESNLMNNEESININESNLQ